MRPADEIYNATRGHTLIDVVSPVGIRWIVAFVTPDYDCRQHVVLFLR